MKRKVLILLSLIMFITITPASAANAPSKTVWIDFKVGPGLRKLCDNTTLVYLFADSYSAALTAIPNDPQCKTGSLK